MVTAQKKKEIERHPDFDTTLHIFETMQVSLKIGFKFVCQVRSTKCKLGDNPLRTPTPTGGQRQGFGLMLDVSYSDEVGKL